MALGNPLVSAACLIGLILAMAATLVAFELPLEMVQRAADGEAYRAMQDRLFVSYFDFMALEGTSDLCAGE
jgi:hypothetical protein